MFTPTLRRCAAPGFWKKTADRIAQQTQFAINLEGLSLPIKPLPILDFADPETSTWMKTMTDKQVGGISTANVKHVPADVSSNPNTPAHMLFEGNISTKLPADRPDVLKTGFAAWRNQDLGNTLFGELFWNVDSYIHPPTSTLHKRAPGSNGPGDPGRWETVLIKWHEFVRTNLGVITEPQSEMLRQKIKSVGIGMTDRSPGPYKLAIAGIWATNLNERGQVDGRTGWQHCDTGSARLHEVTEERLTQKLEERAKLPKERLTFRDRIPPAFGNAGTRVSRAKRADDKDTE
ncbi:Complex I intermediate-associated protein 30, mitochondrial [Cyphellophora attinorum]|uniref:Complex I intermediate-associated protein 30, mitochondrial n=1 Tax=Cyphellophora attinorum TaxID=1664694 RepID=A0A0N1H8B8_9EURO|nr:Complex I intermediate-associated protein 30, mitochondrial [Phialophora attinorum]KPI43150.1 Complex I intermediate-associated protein 30, mitochondrial [Phialophora attinorum]